MAGAELVAEVELAVALTPGEGRAVLGLEAGGANRFEHPGLLDEVQAVRQQALADGEAREALAFQHQHVVPLAFEQGAGDGARWAGTDHNDLALFDFKRLHMGFVPRYQQWLPADVRR
ncbi:hypothetical protein D3C85_1522530 [compost metagenome]